MKTKIYLLVITLLVCNKVDAQNDSCSYKKVEWIKKEIRSIMDTVNKTAISNQPSYEMYVIRFYYLDNDKKDFSFTIGYIMNSSEFNNIKATHYCMVDKQIVLVRLPDTSIIKDLHDLGLKKLDFITKIKSVQKLFPVEVGYITYSPPAITFKMENCNTESKFYQYAGELPPELSIYDSYPTGEIKKVNPPTKNKPYFH